jgi:hypothetical protein
MTGSGVPRLWKIKTQPGGEPGFFVMVEFRAMSKQLRIPEGDIHLLRALQRYEIPFVVIGGHAVRFHGVERGVDDLDVLVDSAGRAEALSAAISEAGGDPSKVDVA